MAKTVGLIAFISFSFDVKRLETEIEIDPSGGQAQLATPVHEALHTLGAEQLFAVHTERLCMQPLAIIKDTNQRYLRLSTNAK